MRDPMNATTGNKITLDGKRTDAIIRAKPAPEFTPMIFGEPKGFLSTL